MKRRLRPRPAGVALVSALMLVLVASVLGVGVARMALSSLAAAQWERDHAVARAAADLALCDAERELRAVQDGAQPGLALGAPVTYGAHTGTWMAVGAGLLPARPPVYLIEPVSDAAPGQGAVFRITAIGFGTRAATQVMVQALYRKRPPAVPGEEGAPPRPPVSTGRIGWREIVAWPALRAGIDGDAS